MHTEINVFKASVNAPCQMYLCKHPIKYGIGVSERFPHANTYICETCLQDIANNIPVEFLENTPVVQELAEKLSSEQAIPLQTRIEELQKQVEELEAEYKKRIEDLEAAATAKNIVIENLKYELALGEKPPGQEPDINEKREPEQADVTKPAPEITKTPKKVTNTPKKVTKPASKKPATPNKKSGGKK